MLYKALMDETARKVGRNEALYRSVNEQIEDLNETFGMLTNTMSVVCECGDLNCARQVEVDLPEYERVRAEPTHFIIIPGHQIESVEDVVEERETYHVVRKHEGGPAELARALDPRS